MEMSEINYVIKDSLHILGNEDVCKLHRNEGGEIVDYIDEFAAGYRKLSRPEREEVFAFLRETAAEELRSREILLPMMAEKHLFDDSPAPVFPRVLKALREVSRSVSQCLDCAFEVRHDAPGGEMDCLADEEIGEAQAISLLIARNVLFQREQHVGDRGVSVEIDARSVVYTTAGGLKWGWRSNGQAGYTVMVCRPAGKEGESSLYRNAVRHGWTIIEDIVL